MEKAKPRLSRWTGGLSLGCCLALAAWTVATSGRAQKAPAADPAAEYTTHVRPLLTQYCLTCHSRKAKKGDLDLERVETLDQARKDARVWQGVLEMLETGEMPPKKSRQPQADERQRLVGWVRGFLDAEARARS